MTTTYKRPITSPYQPKHNPVRELQKKALDIQDSKHPARGEINKLIGEYTITAIVREDTETIEKMRHIPGLTAFMCSLVKDGRVFADGRGSAVINKNNRYISRAIISAFNSSISDAVIRACKVMDTFRATDPEIANAELLEEAYCTKETTTHEAPATEKQLEYLRQLIVMHIDDGEDKEMRLQALESGLTKSEASEAIQKYRW